MIDQIELWFRTQFAENDVFAGFVGSSLILSVFYMLRSLPMRIYRGLQWLYLRHMTVEVTLTNADLGPFLLVANWLNEVVGERWNKIQLDFGTDSYGNVAKHMRSQDKFSAARKLRRALSLGYGSFGFWYKKTYVRVSRARETESKGEGRRKSETLTLRFFTRDRAIIDDVLNASQEEVNPMIYTSNSWGGWKEMSTLSLRDIDTVFLPEGQKERIVDDLTWFYANDELYGLTGIPHTRGYLFHGPPGTGKTTLARALASLYHADLYILSLNDVGSDSNLLELMCSVRNGAFVVFEDVDVVGAVTNRTADPELNNGASSNKTSNDSGVTLGGLLQAIDGINSGHEHVIVMTTNRPETLDEALTRPGRIDLKEEIGLLNRVAAEKMAVKFFGEDFIKYLDEMEFPAAGADIQDHLLTYHKKNFHANR